MVWLEQNEYLFSTAVQLPSILSSSHEEAMEALDEFQNSWSENTGKMTLFFWRGNADSIEIFMVEVRDQLDLKVHTAGEIKIIICHRR